MDGNPTKAEDSAADLSQLSNLVQGFITMMRTGGIQRMDLEYGDLNLTLRARDVPNGGGSSAVDYEFDFDETTAQPGATESRRRAMPSGDHLITAPMIGTFYVAPSPTEPPFVNVGDVVEEGQTIGIIEAMKIMNEIAADQAGVVVAVLASNAQTVEYGSPLVQITPHSNS